MYKEGDVEMPEDLKIEITPEFQANVDTHKDTGEAKVHFADNHVDKDISNILKNKQIKKAVTLLAAE